MSESALSIRISQRPKPTSPFLKSECLVRYAAARPLSTTSETVSAMTAPSASSFADRPAQPMSANATSPPVPLASGKENLLRATPTYILHGEKET